MLWCNTLISVLLLFAFMSLFLVCCSARTSLHALTPPPSSVLLLFPHFLFVSLSPPKVLVQRCLLADVEDRPSAALLEDLMHKLTTPGAWPDYGECAPVRNVKRTVYGLGFDTAARVRWRGVGASVEQAEQRLRRRSKGGKGGRKKAAMGGNRTSQTACSSVPCDQIRKLPAPPS